MTLPQTEAEPHVRGRVFGTYFAIFGVTQLVGMLGAGLLGDLTGVMLINVQAVMYVLAGLAVLVVSARGLNPAAANEAS